MIDSPCINICKMEGGVCVGCLRTLDEIGRWSNASDSEKKRILNAVAKRQEDLAITGHARKQA